MGAGAKGEDLEERLSRIVARDTANEKRDMERAKQDLTAFLEDHKEVSKEFSSHIKMAMKEQEKLVNILGMVKRELEGNTNPVTATDDPIDYFGLLDHVVNEDIRGSTSKHFNSMTKKYTGIVLSEAADQLGRMIVRSMSQPKLAEAAKKITDKS